MAENALVKSGAQIAVAVTGLAGPGGDGSAVPVGTVWIATALTGGETLAELFHFDGSREEVRRCAVLKALQELLKRIP
jgi:nicotinamide-nucleotide amidase